MSLLEKCLLPNGIEFAHINKNETDFLFREIFEDRLYLRYGLILDKDPIVFDVGANIGMFSLFVFLHCQGAKVFAFEPIPEVFEILRINSHFFGWNMELFNVAVSNSIGTRRFTHYPKSSLQSGCYPNAAKDRTFLKATALYQQQETGLSFSSHLLDQLIDSKLGKTTLLCPSVTLSQIIHQYQLPRIDLLKVDVERSEWDVIQGIDSSHWKKIRQVVIEIENKQSSTMFVDILEKNGFTLDVQTYAPLSDTSVCILYGKNMRVDDGSDFSF